MKLVPVQSSNVSSIGWDEENGRMIVQFGDSYYEYPNITSEQAARIIFADSIGKAFNAIIRAPNVPARKIDAREARG